MRTRNHSPETTRKTFRAFMLAALMAAFPAISVAIAQESHVDDSLVPSWRQGVSRWGGEGYTLPTEVTQPAVSSSPEISSLLTPPVTNIEAMQPQSTPYTMPVDPTLPPATGDVQLSPVANPYFQLPSARDMPPADGLTADGLTADGLTALDLDPPGSSNAEDGSIRILPPAAPPSSELVAPQVNGAPIEISTPVGSQEPRDRIEMGADALTIPDGVPQTADPITNTQAGQTEVDTVQPESASEEVALPTPSGSGVDSIAEQIDTNDVVETGPLEPEVIRWYHYPARWMRGWDSHAEFGLDGSEGNARTLAVQTGLEMKRQTDIYTLAIDLDYRLATNRTVTTEDNGRFNVDYDRLIHDSPWSAFGKYGMEWDKFKAFDLRLNLNSGLGYYWVRQDNANLVTRFGAGASKEIGAPDDAWIPEAVMGFEADRQINSRQKVKGKVDYFPAWENFGNYRLVCDVAWEILLDDSDNLSLKLAATDRYDSTPQGAKKNDLYYSLLLLYKF